MAFPCLLAAVIFRNISVSSRSVKFSWQCQAFRCSKVMLRTAGACVLPPPSSSFLRFRLDSLRWESVQYWGSVGSSGWKQLSFTERCQANCNARPPVLHTGNEDNDASLFEV